MLKSIPKSNISHRSFQVFKKFIASDSDYTPITATNVIDSTNYSLYKSIESQYYTDTGLLNNFGKLKNPAEFSTERIFPDTIYVLKLDQLKYGEGIRPSTVVLTTSGSVEITDDGFGKLTSPTPSYAITNFDIDNEILQIVQNGISYSLDLDEVDLNSTTQNLFVLDNGVSERYDLLSIDFENGIMILADPLDVAEIGLSEASLGNVFYSNGLLVITSPSQVDLTEYTLEYRSTQTIHETEVLLEVKAGEFNFSQNPSAVNVTLSGSYDFTTTAIPNVSPAKTVKIKEVRDITQRTGYTGSYQSGSIVTGSWDDYFTYKTTDITGSYLAPFISTIGLYDNMGNMVAIAKLPQPIKNLPDYDLNFIVRFDT